ncbi:aspartyl protease family protein At5g10770-like [Vigna radiata var. radiata]|uniref:Aspartyl protease family protein At5g10770-like n=1 Tax=Vigna radiata var. radiata TaxID=3916 RepID=A0A1S3VMY8_VIGRR|nr:aspartyl protease family protein At5g10770-like [Vigna radiata var. radiata]
MKILSGDLLLIRFLLTESCTSTLCTQLSSATGNDPGCSSATKACIYGIQYGDQSFSVGYFSRERLTVTTTGVINNFLFGCGQNNQGLFGGSAGLIGLGRHPISFVQQTASKYNKIFSYCLPSTSSSTGHLNIGGCAYRKLLYTSFTTISRGSSFYDLDIVSIIVSGVKLSLTPSLFSSGVAIIDSGTVITRLPPLPMPLSSPPSGRACPSTPLPLSSPYSTRVTST